MWNCFITDARNDELTIINFSTIQGLNLKLLWSNSPSPSNAACMYGQPGTQKTHWPCTWILDLCVASLLLNVMESSLSLAAAEPRSVCITGTASTITLSASKSRFKLVVSLIWLNECGRNSAPVPTLSLFRTFEKVLDSNLKIERTDQDMCDPEKRKLRYILSRQCQN